MAPRRCSSVTLQPASQPVQIDGFLSRYQTRSENRNRVEVRAPTGQMSTTQVESGLSSGLPSTTPISACDPRLKNPEERARLTQVFQRGLGEPVGFVMPLKRQMWQARPPRPAIQSPQE